MRTLTTNVKPASTTDVFMRRPLISGGRAFMSNRILQVVPFSNKIAHSLNFIPSRIAKIINSMDVDIVNLHWVGAETLSIADIGRIHKPLVWTCHDAWPFAGASHHLSPENLGLAHYESNPMRFEGWINNSVENRKLRHWDPSMAFVCPSPWLAAEAKRSIIGSKRQVNFIPNPLPVEWFVEISREQSRKILGIPSDAIVFFFGGSGNGDEFNKGSHLYFEFSNLVSKRLNEAIFLVAGESWKFSSSAIRVCGKIENDDQMRLFLSAADLTVIPSLVESAPQIAAESLAVGTPVVGFSGSGLESLSNICSGIYLAGPFDVAQLADISQHVVNLYAGNHTLSESLRTDARKTWDPTAVAAAYIELFTSRIRPM